MSDKKSKQDLNLDGINSSFNDGDGLRINDAENFRSINISNGVFSNNKGNGITIGSPRTTPLETILNQLSPKLPETIESQELKSIIEVLLNSKNTEEFHQELVKSGIKDKFKDPNLWISFSSLLFSIVSTYIPR
ncbi:hypothetical protein [Acinetobacter sp. DSM 11652]|uniref:hypothetical protein n=1 Tax=Acinetobacter sp. DSM 11652 TaxID=346222 RepID=UPI0008B61019|nr:hypothetical protein [Acinetobacter sp. DSM 11652]SEM28430.1 hypothetical protein SAMN05216500_1187 [Acinetobacter sp. DSM 11652]